MTVTVFFINLSENKILIFLFFPQVLLDLARTIFEEQSTLHNIVQKIMMITQTLLQCERCSVLLVDPTSKVQTFNFLLSTLEKTLEQGLISLTLFS